MTIIVPLFAGVFIVWLMFKLATYALPFAVGIWSGFWLLHHDNGFLISIVGGFSLAIFVLALGQILFFAARSSAVRLVLIAVFALPAGIAGYNLIYSFGRLAADPGISLTVLSATGGLFIAIAASRQLAASPLEQQP